MMLQPPAGGTSKDRNTRQALKKPNVSFPEQLYEFDHFINGRERVRRLPVSSVSTN